MRQRVAVTGEVDAESDQVIENLAGFGGGISGGFHGHGQKAFAEVQVSDPFRRPMPRAIDDTARSIAKISLLLSK